MIETDDLIPARMVNEYSYCPRLAYIEWVQGEFEESADTLEGEAAHARVDEYAGAMREPGLTFRARAVPMSAPIAGLTAKMDIVEGTGGKAVPIDYKKGPKPSAPESAWEPDRVQLCAQAIILRENGYTCEEGIIYYVATKDRVIIPIDDALVKRTMELVQAMREMAKAGTMPKPLVDSPKCVGCSLAGICMPDEVNLLSGLEGPVRMLLPSSQERMPLFVQAQGAKASKKGDVIEVHDREKKLIATARIVEISQVCIFGNVSITTPLVQELCAQGIPICYFTYGGRFLAMTTGMPHKNVELRIAQYSASFDAGRSLSLSKAFVAGKIKNCRTILRRNARGDVEGALEALSRFADSAQSAENLESLLGIEGAAARTYFSQFAGMLKEGIGFDFTTRNRRPPKDPVNAMLSFVYSLMARTCAATLLSVGFDPLLGFYHKPRHGRPALALDMMEEMRPIVGDSVVISLVNNYEISERDFTRRTLGCMLNDEGRKKVMRALERRLETNVTHPIFGYSISYRRVFEVQARLLARYVLGEIAEYTPFLTR